MKFTFPEENLFYIATERFKGKYYEDEHKLKFNSNSNNEYNIQKATFNYKSYPFELFHSIFESPIQIKTFLAGNHIPSFKILPLSSSSNLETIIYKVLDLSNKKIITNSFVFEGPKQLSDHIALNKKFTSLYRKKDYTIELVKKAKEPVLVLKPFRGLKDLDELLNCLDISILIAESLKIKN